MRPWLIRILVLLALVVVLYGYGPRAWTVLASRLALGDRKGPPVDIDKVGLIQAPPWLRQSRAIRSMVLADLSPRLRGQLSILDEAALRGLAKGLRASPWVQAVQVRRRFPDRLALHLELRRPVLEVLAVGALAGQAQPVLVDGEGICLPMAPVPPGEVLDLPRLELSESWLEGRKPLWLPGERHPDPRVLAAAEVAVEWRDEVAPKVEGAKGAKGVRGVKGVPKLVVVDASNLNYRYLAERRFSEIRLGLGRADGGVAYLGYGHPPGSPLPRVSVADKARVLSWMLEEHPGLMGIQGGDLRFVNHWRNWLLPRPQASASGS